MIKIIAVGKVKEKPLQTMINEYLKRLQVYHKVIVVEVEDLPTTDNQSKNEKVKLQEGSKIIAQIKNDEYVILLDLKGKQYDSNQFAQKLADIQTYTSNKIVFIIGGSVGVSQEVKNRSDLILSFGKMTFPHHIARLLLVEQIYRAYKINKNEPYHK